MAVKNIRKKFNIIKKPNKDENLTGKQLEDEKEKLSLTKDQVKMKFYHSHFRVIQKNFRSKKHRMNAEAFFIRMRRPTLTPVVSFAPSVVQWPLIAI